MKQVAVVSAQQFSFIYLGGIPYNPVKVKRFLSKGVGIKNGDIVVFDADGDRVLSYLKNALYLDSVEEKKLVKEFVKAAELRRADMSDFDGVSAEIKKQLAEEGIAIYGGEAHLCPAIEKLSEPDMKELMDNIPQGKVISVSFGATINLGNFSNVRLEVTASNYETARNEFINQAKEAVDSVRGLLQNL
jgi:hypothetical protein